jgi:RNA polymerase sigma-70 factor (ECF subfamily)
MSLDSLGGQHFQTTLWTMVIHAGRDDSSQARDAMARLCQMYWYPLYVFVRRQGHQPSDAQDLTQAFFTRLLDKHALEHVDRAKGRFRSFLLGSLKNFLANEWDKAHAQKRGGGQQVISLDHDAAETWYGLEPSHDLSPDRIFERRWALTLLEQVLTRLREEYADGRSELFEELKATLTAESSSASYASIAERLGMTEGAVKVASHRLRQRYRELTRLEIAQTLTSEDDVDDELRYLMGVLSG